jgi:hypothetical protein
MKRALVASLACRSAARRSAVFLILRRMSLMGDALAHALLPGAGAGFLLGGLSLPAMSLGGSWPASATALVSGAIARFTAMREDASFAAAYSHRAGARRADRVAARLGGRSDEHPVRRDPRGRRSGAVPGRRHDNRTLVGLAAIYRPWCRVLQSRLPRRHGREGRALSLSVPRASPC